MSGFVRADVITGPEPPVCRPGRGGITRLGEQGPLHWAWSLFADNLGISPAAITPVYLLAIVPLAIAAANAVAFWAGRPTARLTPAEILRSE
jgi:hypothetical protein